MWIPILVYFCILTGLVEPRELMLRRACQTDPTFSFCRNHMKTAEIRTESQKKRDVFLQWAFVAAKDEQDIEDVDELETTRKTAYSIPDYCTKYAANFKTYCTNGHLEKLEGLLTHFCGSYMKNCNVAGKVEKVTETGKTEEVFPTPTPFYSTTVGPAPKTTYCDGNAQKFKKECEKEGFTPDRFCRKYRELCGKLEKVDADTTKSVDDDLDSLETPDEFEEHEKQDIAVTPKPEEVEGQGAGTDEVTAYCINYNENFNYFCVGDMAPEHEKFCNSYRKNCPDRVSLKQSGSFLGNEGGSERSQEGASSSSDDKTYLYKGSKKEYCEKFSVNYEYYCKGPIENAEIFTKFCPSYKKACVKNQAPANPFSASKGQIKVSSGGDSDFPDVDHPKEGRSKSSRRRSRKLKKRPCSADCDERIFPHCTKECKCDYDYPAVQKFCNPPPLPMFLNTCRLWYYGCPKYEQYHYASQFIYSKAEKGKVLEGPKTQTTFQLLAPSGETLPYKPARFKRETDMVLWPKEPEIESMDNNNNNPIMGNATVDFSMDEKAVEDGDKMVQLKNGTTIHLVAAPPLPKQNKAKDQVLKDSKPAVPNLPRIKKTTGGEAVPVYSDSVFSNALAQYNSLTDSRGILHRPRSRSPFTKPGLWEPNPDDPHNRDHANKYYYRPESVNVDWLQGQIAYGAHWAVPAAGVGGTDGFSAIHFPSLGTFLNIPDDYD
ncbi:hypothetical protein GCK72_011928 [Caenorhabditis remanei]|uniref:Uncharacterized protein n=1 Tax=Caenorhabditis remanei TaxID=31234 RepID=A0A6A5HA04_CAERE|nr:hypothetical protein GCK72_011928 [Caenorhabditis remanei]KAF1763661.1 hypothetical protein GCK72_011928 [Caenorhabditis remanei]